jgi:hypothetical protein
MTSRPRYGRRRAGRAAFASLAVLPALPFKCALLEPAPGPVAMRPEPVVPVLVEPTRPTGWQPAGREPGEGGPELWWHRLRGYPAPVALPLKEIVLRPAELPGVMLHGAWRKVKDPTAAGGMAVADFPDIGRWEWVARREPVHFFDLEFEARAATPYRVWVRLKANRDDRESDATFVQFSDSVNRRGEPMFQINTTSALHIVLTPSPDSRIFQWGWQDGWYMHPFRGIVYFETTGKHILRVQRKEDGVIVDQIVLSPVLYLKRPPGFPVNDQTILGDDAKPRKLKRARRRAPPPVRRATTPPAKDTPPSRIRGVKITPSK